MGKAVTWEKKKTNKKTPQKTRAKKQPCANIYVALYYGTADHFF